MSVFTATCSQSWTTASTNLQVLFRMIEMRNGIAPGISPALGQSVVVENRAGSAVVAADLVAKASPDGYTRLLYGSGF